MALIVDLGASGSLSNLQVKNNDAISQTPTSVILKPNSQPRPFHKAKRRRRHILVRAAKAPYVAVKSTGHLIGRGTRRLFRLNRRPRRRY